MPDPEDLQILPGRVENLDHRCIAKQLNQRIERQPLNQRVHQNRRPGATVGKGKLDQAEFGIIAAFAQKFRVDGDKIVPGRFLAERFEVLRRRDRSHRAPRSCLSDIPPA